MERIRDLNFSTHPRNPDKDIVKKVWNTNLGVEITTEKITTRGSKKMYSINYAQGMLKSNDPLADDLNIICDLEQANRVLESLQR